MSKYLAACLALALSACGGGGSNVKDTPPPPPPPPPPPVDTSPMVVDTDLAVAGSETITRPIVLENGAALDNQGAIGGDVEIAVEAKAPSVVNNHGGGTIRGTHTAIRLAQGGEIYNGVGSTIEATGAGDDCGANEPCAIFVGSNDVAPDGLSDFVLVNEGTIIGNVRIGPGELNAVYLAAGSSIHGDLDIASDGASSLELNGGAGTVQEYSEAVTGATSFDGILYKMGDGTWIVDNTDLSPSQVMIDGGTLQIGNGGTTGGIDTNRIFLLSGQLVFNRSDDIIFDASFAGPSAPEKGGTLVHAGSGTLTIANSVGSPDFISIESGTLEFENTGGLPPGLGKKTITASIVNDAALVYNSNGEITQYEEISGSGSVTQNGSNVLVFHGINTYTGGTTINNGALKSRGVIPGDVTVNSSGTLGDPTPSNGPVDPRYGLPGVAGDVTNDGRVIVRRGDSAIGGNYQQSSTGTLAVSLGSQLDVAGTVTLDGGVLEVVGADDGYVANDHTEVLTAGGGLTGTFDQLVKGPGVVFTSSTINYDANSVWLDTTGLDVTMAAAGGGVDYTPASMGSAVRVQGAFDQLNKRIASNSLADVSDDFLLSAGRFQRAPSLEGAQASLRSLSGELHAAAAAMSLRAIDMGNQALSDHLDQVREGRAGIGMWTQRLDNRGAMSRSGFDGIGFQLGGWLVGNDYRIGSAGVVGFAFGQGAGMQQIQHGIDRNDSRYTEGTVYAASAGERWYTHGRLALGQVHQDVNRGLLLGRTFQGVWTRYQSRYQMANAEAGMQFSVGGLRLTPFAGMDYARVDRGAFEEEGAGGFGLRSDAHGLVRWQANMGVRATRQWNFGGGKRLDVGLHAQQRRVLAVNGESMQASFAGIEQWSPLLGIGLSRTSTLVGFGINASLSPRSALRFAYDYERGQYDSAGGVSAGVSVAF